MKKQSLLAALAAIILKLFVFATVEYKPVSIGLGTLSTIIISEKASGQNKRVFMQSGACVSPILNDTMWHWDVLTTSVPGVCVATTSPFYGIGGRSAYFNFDSINVLKPSWFIQLNSTHPAAFSQATAIPMLDNNGRMWRIPMDTVALYFPSMAQFNSLSASVAANTSNFTNYYTKPQSDARYLQSFTELDPFYSASSWFSTTNNNANWNTAFGWGNHASAGYLLASTAASTYYLQTNPSGYITSSALSPYLTASTAASTYYLQSNPSSYITASALSPYITTSAANATFYPISGNPSNFLTSITSGNVTTALGYTPAKNTDSTAFRTASNNAYYPLTGNPSNFLTSLSGAVLTSRTLTINGSAQDLSSNRTWNVGTIIGSDTTNFRTYSNILYDPKITASNTVKQYYNGFKNFATLNTDSINEGTNQFYTNARARASISLTTTGTSGASSYNNSTGVLNIPQYASVTPTFNNAVSRAINGTTYTVSSSQPARLYYSISISCTATIGSNSAGSVLFEYSTNGGSSWNQCGEVKNSNTVTLAVVLQSVTIQQTMINVEVPANALCRMTTTSSGTTTVTYVRGNEILY